jgi:hypothetical protein
MRNSHPIEPEELMAYLDGELSPAKAMDAAGHLAQCRECQAVAADLQGVARRLMSWQVDAPEFGMNADSATSEAPKAPVKTKSTSTGWLVRRWPWAVGLVGACLLLVVVGSVTMSRYPKLDAPKTGAFLTAPEPTPAQLPADQAPAGSKAVLPRFARTSQITLTAPDFAKTQAALETMLARFQGYIEQLHLNSPTGSGHSIQGTLRIPSKHLAEFLAALRTLGHVESETQGGEEVTQQVVDLDARLNNARNTEQRLNAILRDRTGKISDVLEVEKEINRVREEIERMVAQRKNLDDRVAFAIVNVTISEEYRADLQAGPPSASRQLRNAAIEGWRNLSESLFSVAQFLLSSGPVLLVWAAVLFFPGRYLWRRWRRRPSY